jgi:hypothetical protein
LGLANAISFENRLPLSNLKIERKLFIVENVCKRIFDGKIFEEASEVQEKIQMVKSQERK